MFYKLQGQQTCMPRVVVQIVLNSCSLLPVDGQSKSMYGKYQFYTDTKNFVIFLFNCIWFGELCI